MKGKFKIKKDNEKPKRLNRCNECIHDCKQPKNILVEKCASDKFFTKK